MGTFNFLCDESGDRRQLANINTDLRQTTIYNFMGHSKSEKQTGILL